MCLCICVCVYIYDIFDQCCSMELKGEEREDDGSSKEDREGDQKK